MSELSDRLASAKDKALINGVPGRRSDASLYYLLRDCLAICELVRKEGLQQELRERVRVSVDASNPEIWGTGREQSNNGRGRRYVEAHADDHVLVCRYVLSEENRSAVYRYAQALRNASQFQLTSDTIADFLFTKGGVRALYNAETKAKPGRTKVLNLSSWVHYPSEGDFTITLRHNGSSFDVVKSCCGVSAVALA